MKQAKRQLAGSGEALPAGAVGEVKSSNVAVGGNLLNSSTPRIIVQVTGVSKGVYLVQGTCSFDTSSVADGFVSMEIYDGTSSYNSVKTYLRTTANLDGSLSNFAIVNVTADNTTLSLRVARTAGQCFVNTYIVQALRIA